jgi:hypothetical protein
MQAQEENRLKVQGSAKRFFAFLFVSLAMVFFFTLTILSTLGG